LRATGEGDDEDGFGQRSYLRRFSGAACIRDGRPRLDHVVLVPGSTHQQPPALAVELPDAYAPGTDLEFRFSVAALRFQEVYPALLKSESSPFG